MKRLKNLLLLASFIFLIVSCGSSKDVGDTYHGAGLVDREKTLVMDNVEDKDRMTKLLIVIDEEGDLLNNFESTQKDYFKQFMKIMDDYNSSEEELTTTVMDYHTQFKSLVLSMLEKNAELKAQASSKEWEDISNWKKENLFKK